MTIKLNLERSKKKITPYGGTIILQKAITDLKIKELVNSLIAKGNSNRAKEPSDFVLPIVTMTHIGGSSLTDLDRLSEDETFKAIHGLKSIPHSTTFGSWLRKNGGAESQDIPNSSTLEKLEYINTLVACKGIKKEKLSEVTLDIDATMIETEKQESAWTYKKFKGMSSLLGFVAETGYVVGEEFRNGNISPSERNYEFMKTCINNIESSSSLKVTKFRSDSAGYQGKIIDYCIDNDIEFYIGGVMNNPVVKGISLIPGENWKPFTNEDGSKVNNHHVTSFTHTMQGNTHSFRVVVERKPISEEADTLYKVGNYLYRVIATSSTEEEVKVIQTYNKRGTCENFIKEVKCGFSLEDLPCGTVRANAVWFKIGILAYNIAIYMKRIILQDDFSCKLIKTIGYQLYNIPGQIVRHAGKTILKLSCSINRFKQISSYFQGNYLEI